MGAVAHEQQESREGSSPDSPGEAELFCCLWASLFCVSPRCHCTGEEKWAFLFTPVPGTASFPGRLAQLDTAGLSLDFQVLGEAAAVLQRPALNSDNAQEDSGLRAADVEAALSSVPWFRTCACRMSFHPLLVLLFAD